MTGGRGLRDVLGTWTAPQAFGRYDPTPRRTISANKKISKQLRVEARPPAKYDRDDLFERARRAVDSRDLLRLQPRDLRRLPWVLFYPASSPKDSWLGAQEYVQRTYQRWALGRPRAATVIALVHEFLQVHPTDLPTFEGWLRLVRTLVASSRAPSLQKLDRDLFVENGHRKVVGRMIADGDGDVARFGVSAGLAGSAFLASGARAHLRLAGNGIRSRSVRAEDVGGLLDFLEVDGRLRFPDESLYTVAADELLAPLGDDHEDPQGLRDRICAWFVKWFGDPRLREYAYRWRDVSSDARTVVERWLIADTFEQFFLLIRKTAYDRHWPYRQAFWSAYLKRNMIDGAWFVLGTRARDLLRQVPEAEDIACGSLSGGTSDQSVLMMKIGGITVAEWSHNGSCRIWNKNRQWAPDLYQDAYSRDELASATADFVQRHDGSAYGRWQSRVAEAIFDRTGREVEWHEYMDFGT